MAHDDDFFRLGGLSAAQPAANCSLQVNTRGGDAAGRCGEWPVDYVVRRLDRPAVLPNAVAIKVINLKGQRRWTVGCAGYTYGNEGRGGMCRIFCDTDRKVGGQSFRHMEGQRLCGNIAVRIAHAEPQAVLSRQQIR